ncbi:MAG: site-2 protease family protein [Patescibacteria group bacterium]
MEHIIFFLSILIFSVVLHEVSHGLVAHALGDPTAKNAGRLTLNPIPHIDPIGSLLLPALLLFVSGGQTTFGWAKPVPVNPFNLRDRKYGSAKVSFAGPASNLGIALLFGLFLRFLPITELNPALVPLFVNIIFLNLILAIFNLLPIPPLDGSHILFPFLPSSLEFVKTFLLRYGFFILLFVIFFLFDFILPVVQWFFHLIVGF